MKKFLLIIILFVGYPTLLNADNEVATELLDIELNDIIKNSNNMLNDNIYLSNFTLNNLIGESGLTEFKANLIEPIYQDDKNGNTIFFQGMLGRFSQFGKYRTGLNLGIGERFFSENYSKMYGYNFFYDTEIEPFHHRLSFGIEYREADFKISNNYYKGISEKKKYKNQNEEVLDGLDLIISGYVPLAPWIEPNLSFSFWNAQNTKNVREISLDLNLNINDHFSLGFSASDDNINPAEYAALISIRVGNNKVIKPTLFGINKNIIPQDMKKYSLELVKRSDKLMLESTGAFTVKVNKSG